jgi:hypothetical protein
MDHWRDPLDRHGHGSAVTCTPKFEPRVNLDLRRGGCRRTGGDLGRSSRNGSALLPFARRALRSAELASQRDAAGQMCSR